MFPTLKQLNQVFFIEGVLSRMPRRKATEYHFVETLLPDEFLQEEYEVAPVFKNYEGGHNPIRNRLFNGNTSLSHGYQERIVTLFSNHPQIWTSFIDKCNKVISIPSCKRSQLEEYLLSVFGDLEQYNLPDNYCKRIRSACFDQQEVAIATAIFYVLMDGNINFLTMIEERTRPATDNIQLNYLDTCICFLRNSIKPLLDVDDTQFQDTWELYSKMFEPIASVFYGEQRYSSVNLLDNLCRVLVPHNPQNLLHVEGPSGSDKNALLQLLFLKLCREHIRSSETAVFAPFYISLNYYEKNLSGNLSEENYTECAINQYFEEQFEYQLKKFKAFCEMAPHLRPIIFIDGIRNYRLGVPLDAILTKCLRSLQNLYYVIGLDIGLTGDAPRQRNLIALLGSSYFCTVKLSSLELYKKEESLQFLDKFCRIYSYDPSGLYEKLVGLSFYSVDAYQLRILYPLLEASPTNIGQLYDAYCERYFDGDTTQIDNAALNAYQFTYTTSPISLSNYYSDRAWRLMRRHTSFIDYFIARYYVRILLSQTQSSLNLDEIDIVFPKSITRFIISHLNQDARMESNILRLTTNYYYKMRMRAKSEMTYWLGRMQHQRPRQQATQLLYNLYRESSDKLRQFNNSNPCLQEEKEALFLHRGIAVSLIYLGQTQVSNEYIQSLIQDPLANEINRGFHLEYYGDIPYLPTVDSLSFCDNVQTGEKTLTQLFLICDNGIKTKNFPHAFELCLFTICSLIQARVIQNEASLSFALAPHIYHLTRLLQTYLGYNRCTSNIIQEYFSMILADSNSYVQSGIAYYPLQPILYNFYSELKDIPRAGWVSHDIPHPESISVHMYNGWLMAFLLLPDSTAEDNHYSKDSVMKILLIHDLAERTTGDIERPVKEMNRQKYQQLENFAMSKLLLKGTYPAIGSMIEEYKLWMEWLSLSTYNAKVAKDIDRIQAVYQLCEYLLQYRNHFTEDKISGWVLEYNELLTELGKSLFRAIVLNNGKFSVLKLNKILNL